MGTHHCAREREGACVRARLCVCERRSLACAFERCRGNPLLDTRSGSTRARSPWTRQPSKNFLRRSPSRERGAGRTLRTHASTQTSTRGETHSGEQRERGEKQGEAEAALGELEEDAQVALHAKDHDSAGVGRYPGRLEASGGRERDARFHAARVPRREAPREKARKGSSQPLNAKQ